MKFKNIYNLAKTRLSINQGFIEKDILLSKPNKLNTFNTNQNDFAVILKGGSIKELGKIYKNFTDCLIVNKFDEELDLIGKYLKDKNIVHLVNKSKTAILSKDNYQKYNINEILLYKDSTLKDYELFLKIYRMKAMGLKTVFLPKNLLEKSGDLFGKNGHYKINNKKYNLDFTKKFPSTGFLAIYYALKVIKPKNLWIIGLDFYQKDYLVRRSWNTPINVMQKKMEKINGHNIIETWISKFPNTIFNIHTYFDGFNQQKNLRLYHYDKK